MEPVNRLRGGYHSRKRHRMGPTRADRSDRGNGMRKRDSGIQGFRKVRKDQSSVCADVIEQVKTLIRDGSYRPGDRLPGERKLAEHLGVGRYALREALRTLSS